MCKKNDASDGSRRSSENRGIKSKSTQQLNGHSDQRKPTVVFPTSVLWLMRLELISLTRGSPQPP